jgi:hypothetical protein
MRTCLKRMAAIVMIGAIGFMSRPAAAQQPIISTFDTDDDGWQVYDTTPVPTLYPLEHVPSGGLGGAYVRAHDQSGWSMYFEAPAKFLGDQSPFFGGHMSFDLHDTGVNPELDWADVALIGDGLTLVHNIANPSTTGWSHYDLRLDETGGWLFGYFDNRCPLPAALHTPTAAQFQSVLASLQHVRIMADFWSGGDITSLDNVRIQSTPEPGSYALACCALLTVAVLRARHRRSG